MSGTIRPWRPSHTAIKQFRVEAEKISMLSLGRGILTNKRAVSAEKINRCLRKTPPEAKEFDCSTWPFFRFCYKNNAF